MANLRRDQLEDIAEELLGIPMSSTADEAQQAFRDDIKNIHPDIADDPDEDMFKAMKQARNIISDGEYLDDGGNRRTATNIFVRAVDEDLEEDIDDGGISEGFNLQEGQEIHLEFSISVLADLVLEEMAPLFTIDPTSKEMTDFLFSQILKDGYTAQSLDDMRIGEFASMLRPFTVDDVDDGELVEVLEDADMQVRRQFGGVSGMFGVSKVIGSLIAGGIITPGDLAEDDSDSPWEYSSSKKDNAWQRTGEQSGAWER